MTATTGMVLPAHSAQQPDLRQGTLRFIGTATVLIEYGGFTILTDPNFLHRGDHVHIGYGLTSRRLTEPALALEELPPVDLVVLSHLHEDHFDRLVQRDLDHTLPILTTPSAAESLQTMGFRWAQGLSQWEAKSIEKGEARLRVTALPAEHARGPMKYALPPVIGTLLEFSRAGEDVRYRIYLTGDTRLIEQMREIGRRYPSIDLMVLHLGGTRVVGMLVTMDAKEGVQAVKLVAPRHVVPVHYNDYTVFKSPIEDFLWHAKQAGLAEHVAFLEHGETYSFAV